MTKEDLKEYRWLVESIATLESEIQDLRDQIDVKSPIWSDMPSGKAEGDLMATVVAQIVDTRDKLLDEMRKAMTKRREIERAIEMLPEREKALIRYRYIKDLEWKEICNTMHYSFQMIHRLHAKALTTLKNMELINTERYSE